MKFRTIEILIFFIFFNINCYSKDVLVYSTVGVFNEDVTFSQHKDIMQIIEHTLDKKIKFKYIKNHIELVNSFIKGDVDIAYFGPIPFIYMKRLYKEYSPLVLINNENGHPYYRCMLIKAWDGPKDYFQIKSLALTNPLSTCGYFGVASILRKHSININMLNYTFIGSHDDVALAVVRGEYDAGGVRDKVAEKYKGFLIDVMDSTDYLPGFVLVANSKTITKKESDLLTNRFMSLTEKELGKLSTGRYGFSIYFQSVYEGLVNNLNLEILQRLIADYEKK